ncbi:MAG: N-acetylmuramoyl-L-alanine amidase [Oligoflexia bacterium]|nr:N-acetylmuramoyl-L-alanine amidase [Oligoflexia bacterium]
MPFSPKAIVVHHSATAADATLDEIRRAHVARGWDDIGYHWLLDQNGFLQVGRSDQRAGAHALGLNDASLGICCIGDYEDNPPKVEMVAALERLLIQLCRSHAIDSQAIIPHRDVIRPDDRKTKCPGEYLYRVVVGLREAVARRLAATPREVEAQLFLTSTSFDASGLRAAGIAWNSGATDWLGSVEAPLRVGVKLSAAGTLVWEGRGTADLPEQVVPGSWAPFSLVCDYSLRSNEQFALELDLVREGKHWFKDFGNTGLVHPFIVQVGSRSVRRAASLVLESVVRSEPDRFEFAGRLKNTGEQIIGDQDTAILWSLQDSRLARVGSGKFSFPVDQLEPGQESWFAYTVVQKDLPNQLLSLEVSPAIVDGAALEKGDRYLMRPAVGMPAAGLFAARFSAISITRTEACVALISGRVENAGILQWCRQGALGLVLGMEVKRAEAQWQNPLHSLRFEIPETVAPGAHFEFEFELGLLEMEAESLDIRINLLSEGRFWLDDWGSSSVQLPIPPTRRHSNHPVPASSQTVMVISATLPHFDREGGAARLYRLIKLLRSMKWELQFVYGHDLSGVDGSVYRSALEAHGVMVRKGVLGALCASRAKPPAMVILGWFETGEKYLPYVRRLLPASKAVVDSVDLHWLRFERGVAAGCLDCPPAELALIKSRELSVYSSADAVIAVSDRDGRDLRAENPDIPIVVIPGVGEPSRRRRPFRAATDVFFIGNFAHAPNVSAALWAAEICAQARRIGGPPFRFLIVGAEAPAPISHLHDGVQNFVLGQVVELEAIYDRSRVLLAPLKFGAGINIKICDAINAGIPVVTTPAGVAGLELTEESGIMVGDTTAVLAQLILSVLEKSEAELQVLTERAADALSRRHGSEISRRGLGDLLKL